MLNLRPHAPFPSEDIRRHVLRSKLRTSKRVTRSDQHGKAHVTVMILCHCRILEVQLRHELYLVGKFNGAESPSHAGQVPQADSLDFAAVSFKVDIAHSTSSSKCPVLADKIIGVE
ncbi:uncharacterized protein FOMMEDRAFT_151423 [Fomitiporia mediterranea MF3/22]|uniref:uncharacterized protein n=1 Tax=Fomitiporia mediterranea (strain MF3/22) TaxID=694068 RepID=UPI0004408EA5|nr:uncharacterized protein FOMMEDRAFT_151423 [Fomitiporia mediterranea MF3/22]EJD08555.1 hypothetical protein FOMMEDRAFT_151423 [Fomitiporia mediterranea MF3/22]